MATAELPSLLTVPEAARALRIGRATAYELAHAWLDSGGTEGLPVVTIGRSMRVPVIALERLFAIGGFGPAWQSGLDGRRRCHDSPDPAERPANESTSTLAPARAADAPPVEPTRAPGRRVRTASQQQRSGQLGLFDDPAPCS